MSDKKDEEDGILLAYKALNWKEGLYAIDKQSEWKECLESENVPL